MDCHERLHLYQMAEFLSHVFGPAYHFAYYDAEDIAMRRATFVIGEENLQKSIACTELVRKLTLEEQDANIYYKLGMEQEGAAGYRHNAFIFKKEDGSLAGIFLISDNFGAKKKLLSEIENMFNVKMEAAVAPAATGESGLVPVSISSLSRLVRQLLDDLDIETSGNLTPNQKIKMIRELRERGAFKLKGAVPIIAQLLNTSIPTVYRYLNRLDQQESLSNEIHGEYIHLL